jgi:hypothetical protein
MQATAGLFLFLTFIFSQCNLKQDQYKNHKIIMVKDLGFSFKIPPNCYIDSFSGPGNVYVSIRSGLDFFGAIQRNSNHFSKEVFLQEAKTFEYLEKDVEILINKDTSSIRVIRNKRVGVNYLEKYYFKFVDTDFYNFMIWAKDTVLLKTFVETFKTDDRKLASDYKERIDYEISGSNTINFLKGATTIKRNGNNFFSLNYKDNKMIDILVKISGTNCTTFRRANNFYNLRVEDKTKDYIEITVLAKYKDWQFRKIFTKKYRIID